MQEQPSILLWLILYFNSPPNIKFEIVKGHLEGFFLVSPLLFALQPYVKLYWERQFQGMET